MRGRYLAIWDVAVASSLCLLSLIALIFFPMISKRTLEILLFVTIIVAIFKNILLNNNRITFYFLFIISFSAFLASRVFLDFMRYISIDYSDSFFVKTPIPSRVTKEAISLLIVSLAFIDFGYSMPCIIKKDILPISKEQELRLARLSFLFVLITGPAAYFTLFLVVNAILKNGYYALYTLGSINRPVLIRILDGFFPWFCLLSLTIEKKNKKRLIVTAFYVLFVLLSLLRGARGYTFISLLVLALLFSEAKGNGIRIVPVIIIFLLMLAISAIIVSFRSNGALNTSLLFTISRIGISYDLLPLTIQYHEAISSGTQYGHWGFMLSPLIDLFVSIPANQSFARVVASPYYSDVVSYYFNPRLYDSGAGMGGNYIAVLFLNGKSLGVLLGSFVIGVSMKSINALRRKSKFLQNIRYIIIPFILWLPRGEVLGFIGRIDQVLFLFLTFIFFRIRVGRKKCGTSRLFRL